MPNADGDHYFAGLRHVRHYGRKYEHADYIEASGRRIRMLSQCEMDAFRKGVQRIIDGETVKPVPLDDG